MYSIKFNCLKSVHIIAFTHNHVDLDDIGQFHIEDSALEKRLKALKTVMELDELMYLSTCNRVELIFTIKKKVDKSFLSDFFSAFHSSWDKTQIENAISLAEIYKGEKAVEHIFRVASSLDSLVIGEREIITQVRKAYDVSNKYGFTGDVIRLLTQRTIQVAKKIYTESDISKNPVSVVSLAYHQLREKNIKKDSSFIIVGAGKTISTMLKFLSKHGYDNFTIYNRNKGNAAELVNKINIKSEVKELTSLKEHSQKFDVIITCTGSSNYIFTKEVYNKISNNDSAKKIVIDLALPSDFDPIIADEYNLDIISIKNLKKLANENLIKRSKEINKCQLILNKKLEEFKAIYKERKLERAMRTVPDTIKDITSKAYSEVFAKDLENLDEESRELLDKFVQYLEKKYISVPMKMAKEIMLKQNVE